MSICKNEFRIFSEFILCHRLFLSGISWELAEFDFKAILREKLEIFFSCAYITDSRSLTLVWEDTDADVRGC